jgi:hypothetical protein
MLPIQEWVPFYTIVGTAAGALIGLQFVAIALLADIARPNTEGGIEAFGTPTILHFGTALFVSAVVSAPWHSMAPPVAILGIAGTIGFAYSLLVAHRARTQSAYQPVLEDWIFHVALPAIAYATIAAGAFAIHLTPYAGLIAIGAAALLLIFVAIHNAWDNVTYFITLAGKDRSPQADRTPDN